MVQTAALAHNAFYSHLWSPKKKGWQPSPPSNGRFLATKSINLFALKSLALPSNRNSGSIPRQRAPCGAYTPARLLETGYTGTPFLHPGPTHCMDHISSWLLSHLSQNVPKIGLEELQICYQMRWKCLTYTCQLWDQGGPPARNKALVRHPKNNDSITACAQQDEAMLFGDPHECQWNLQHCFFSQPHSALTN